MYSFEHEREKNQGAIIKYQFIWYVLVHFMGDIFFNLPHPLYEKNSHVNTIPCVLQFNKSSQPRALLLLIFHCDNLRFSSNLIELISKAKQQRKLLCMYIVHTQDEKKESEIRDVLVKRLIVQRRKTAPERECRSWQV